MKKQLFTFFLIWNSCSTLCAQTTVNGFISANTTWDLAGSPYIVTGNALLSNGFTLVIEPGVVVKFDTDKALQIDGELIAIGTSNNRITFTSNQNSPAPGDWAKIHFSDFSTDATFDAFGNYTSGSVLKYCDILYGGGLGFGAIHNTNSAPYINHCRVENSASSGLYSFEPGNNLKLSKIDSSLFKNCTETGIYGRLAEHSSSIIADTFENNNQGVFVSLFGYTTATKIEISKSYFTLNNAALSLNHDVYTDPIPITENYFTDNNSVFYFNSSGNGNLMFECNHILNNQGGIFSIGNTISGTIKYNIFEGNTASGAVINLPGGSTSYTLDIMNNIMKNNNVPNGSCFSLFINTKIKLKNNEIINNNALHTLHIYRTDDFEFSFNNISNPNCAYELYNETPYGLLDINAMNNYWGSTSMSHVDSIIYDYFDYANQSVVYYQPILSQNVIIDSLCQITSSNFIIEDKKNLVAKVYPNPAKTKLIINFEAVLNEVDIAIYDMMGKQILYNKKQMISNEEINVDSFPNGVYLLRIVNNEEKYYLQRFVVQH